MSLDVRVVVPGRVEAAFTSPLGETVAVIGPNGAGKSTLVGAVAGLVRAGGHVRLGKEELTERTVRDRRIGFVFQDKLLFPHLSALANVAFGPRSRGTPRRAAEQTARDWLERLGIGDLAGRKPGQLSGGQAQRVAIARALATDPQLLLLDEPMAGLDVRVATALRIELAHHLAAYGGTTLLVTHDALDALTIADRVLVLDEGRVAQFGTPAEVAAQPATEHVAQLVGLNVLRDGDHFTAFPPSAVNVSLDEPAGSARLHWRGTVTNAAPHGEALRLRASTESGPELIADVTPAAATELSLAPGRAVWLTVKETAVRRY
ncbi:sulfate/molybdate ABC transporter ATP-binding protein [Nocardioides speluncae]|uniref:sulfate/molybdate ABC transporter ATP-binding protein n=1 Tax=Nocardioides speluncae TaxID=2670337 RepID=UPI000D696D6B|nr:ABC transporter ATP-binding protein [Nocardioides speluncae]